MNSHDTPQQAPPPPLPAPHAGNGNGGVGRPAQPGHAHDENVIPSDLPRPSRTTIAAAVLIFCALLVVLFLLGWIPSRRHLAEAREDARAQSDQTPAVEVAFPKQQASATSVSLPCDVKSLEETAIFPRTNGYLKTLRHDIGDHVQAGELLAEIDTPEVDAQLAQSQANMEQAEANVQKAEADKNLAKTTYDRYQKTGPGGGVSQQQIDQQKAAYDDAVSGLEQTRASVVAAEADVKRLQVLQGFEKVTAPFTGTITARNYDIGALLSATDTAAGHEMFRIAQTDTLRVFVNVPQDEATNVRTGQPARLVVRNYPGRHFDGTVARTAGAIDPVTRTLSVELHFPNPKGELYAGMYGEANLDVVPGEKTLVIPSSALLFNANGKQVAIVHDGKVHLQSINIGKDLGTEMEITSGLNPNDEVVSNPGEKLAEGVQVKVVNQPQPGQGSPTKTASAN